MAELGTPNGADAERQRQLISGLAAYISDLALMIQRATARGVEDEMVNVIHAAAIRQDQLCGALLILADEVACGRPESFDSIEAALHGEAAHG